MKQIVNIACAVGLTAAIMGYVQHADAMRKVNQVEDIVEADVFHCNESRTHCFLDSTLNVSGALQEEFHMKYDPPLNPLTAANKKEVQCLAKNIMEEADPKSNNDRMAIAWATINRVKDKRFPNTICGVVYQKGAMSWTKDPVKRHRKVMGHDIWFAKQVLVGKVPNPIGKATNWHNPIDQEGSFNERMMNRKSSSYCKLSNSVHRFIHYE